MLTSDPEIKPKIALAWCINAKNTLENVKGFSPAQIVFGRNPKLPNLFSAGPTGFEEVAVSKTLAQHINAMHKAREAFIESESDRTLKFALKQRIYKGVGDVDVGEWIYYKNSKKWEGPVKIHSKDGKLLYSVRANKLLTINSDHVMLTKADDVFGVKPDIRASFVENKTWTEPFSTNHNPPDAHHMIAETEQNSPTEPINDETDSEGSIDHDQGETLRTQDPVPETAIQASTSELSTQPGGVSDSPGFCPMNAYDVKRNDFVRFKRENSDVFVTAKVLNCAGKRTGAYRYWWNLVDQNTGHVSPENLQTVENLEKCKLQTYKQVFAVNVPRWLHGSVAVREAKEVELANFDRFDVY